MVLLLDNTLISNQDSSKSGGIACSVRYFCVGALLIFIGSVLLCALGFTIVLPHEATRTWPEVVCNVTNSSYNRKLCACEQQVMDPEHENCVGKYPCLQVRVWYSSNHSPNNDSISNITHAVVYRSWSDAFFKTCSLQECGDEEWNSKEARKFRLKWGKPGMTYPCYYEPANISKVIVEKTPTNHMIHAIFWPALCLCCGTVIWVCLCMGCWQMDDDNPPPTYGLL